MSKCYLLILLAVLFTCCHGWIYINPDGSNISYVGSESEFGPQLGKIVLNAYVYVSNPEEGCEKLIAPIPPANFTNNSTNTYHASSNSFYWIALIKRGECDFINKVLNAQSAGALFVIVYNNVTLVTYDTLLTMQSGDSTLESSVYIPSTFITLENGLALIESIQAQLESTGLGLLVSVNSDQDPNKKKGSNWAVIVFVGILAILVSSFFIMVFLIVEIYRQRRRHNQFRPKPVPVQVIISIPLVEITEEHLHEDQNPTCAICLDDFETGMQVRQLVCNHKFHQSCVDPWFLKHNRVCPTCKQDITVGIEVKKIGKNGALEDVDPSELPEPSVTTSMILNLIDVTDEQSPSAEYASPSRSASQQELEQSPSVIINIMGDDNEEDQQQQEIENSKSFDIPQTPNTPTMNPVQSTDLLIGDDQSTSTFNVKKPKIIKKNFRRLVSEDATSISSTETFTVTFDGVAPSSN